MVHDPRLQQQPPSRTDIDPRLHRAEEKTEKCRASVPTAVEAAHVMVHGNASQQPAVSSYQIPVMATSRTNLITVPIQDRSREPYNSAQPAAYPTQYTTAAYSMAYTTPPHFTVPPPGYTAPAAIIRGPPPGVVPPIVQPGMVPPPQTRTQVDVAAVSSAAYWTRPPPPIASTSMPPPRAPTDQSMYRPYYQ